MGVVLQQCLATPFHPQVQLLCLVFIAEVSRVVSYMLLDARPRGVAVAAAEGDAIHQVLPLHVTPQSAREGEKERVSGPVLCVFDLKSVFLFCTLYLLHHLFLGHIQVAAADPLYLKPVFVTVVATAAELYLQHVHSALQEASSWCVRVLIVPHGLSQPQV